jgi:hypothetical protein
MRNLKQALSGKEEINKPPVTMQTVYYARQIKVAKNQGLRPRKGCVCTERECLEI